MSLPPFARSLDARFGWPAFAAATFGTVGDDPLSDDEKRSVEASDADRYDPHDVHEERVRRARLARSRAALRYSRGNA